MKSSISKKSKYWIPKHRYLELKNWVRQYEDWHHDLIDMRYLKSKNSRVDFSSNVFNRTEELAIFSARLTRNMEIVEQACLEVMPDDSAIFLIAVTKGLSYDALAATRWMSVSRAEWYESYRKFFYILDKKRD